MIDTKLLRALFLPKKGHVAFACVSHPGGPWPKITSDITHSFVTIKFLDTVNDMVKVEYEWDKTIVHEWAHKSAIRWELSPRQITVEIEKINDIIEEDNNGE